MRKRQGGKTITNDGLRYRIECPSESAKLRWIVTFSQRLVLVDHGCPQPERGRMTCQDEERKRFSTSSFGNWDVRVSEWVIK